MVYALAILEAIQDELLLFGAFWFLVGALDDLCIDAAWVACVDGRGKRNPEREKGAELNAPCQASSHRVEDTSSARAAVEVQRILRCIGGVPVRLLARTS